MDRLRELADRERRSLNQQAILLLERALVVRPSMPIIPYDAAAAQWHGAACAALEAEGWPRPFADGQMAAIAATRDLILVTRNTSDFEFYAELHVENWFVH